MNKAIHNTLLEQTKQLEEAQRRCDEIMEQQPMRRLMC